MALPSYSVRAELVEDLSLEEEKPPSTARLQQALRTGFDRLRANGGRGVQIQLNAYSFRPSASKRRSSGTFMNGRSISLAIRFSTRKTKARTVATAM